MVCEDIRAGEEIRFICGERAFSCLRSFEILKTEEEKTRKNQINKTPKGSPAGHGRSLRLAFAFLFFFLFFLFSESGDSTPQKKE